MAHIDRTVALTGRRPVRIIEAEVRGDSWRGDAGDQYAASHRGEMAIRRHADGRALVYGSLYAGDPGESWRGGELLDAGADVAAARRRGRRAAGRARPRGRLGVAAPETLN